MEQSTPIHASVQPREERRYEGVGVSPGIAIGPAYVFAVPSYAAEAASIAPEDVEEELARFRRSLQRAERELRKVSTFARDKLGEASASIFEAQILLLNDPTMWGGVEALVRHDLHSADYAVQTALATMRRRLEASKNEYLRERAGDIGDVQDRILRNLQQARAVSRIDPKRVVVAASLTAADVLVFSRRNILGVATDYGGPTSHVSIMARSLGVPAVMSLHSLSQSLIGDETIILDGFTGRVIVNPTPETIETYRARRKRYRAELASRREAVHLPADTRDGVHIALRANVELEEEMPLVVEYGAEGIGLFRTEMLLLARGRPLDEEEQFAVYRNVVRAAAPHATTFRLVDLGGDKMLPMAHREHNPFLGWRGVRILLDRPEILRPQLRAILRAAVHGPARILVPMVSALDEVHRVRYLIREAAASLAQEGIEYCPDVPLGLMVEVPAVALAAERFAAEADFLSLGTNDLTQFVLAVDRGNDLVSDQYKELHPAVLALIQRTARAGTKAGIPVSLCGEMAGNPRYVPLLLGLGLRELSLSPTFLPEVKQAVRAVDLPDAERLARQALDQPDPQSVRTLVDQWMRERLPDLAPFFDHDPDS